MNQSNSDHPRKPATEALTKAKAATDNTRAVDHKRASQPSRVEDPEKADGRWELGRPKDTGRGGA